MTTPPKTMITSLILLGVVIFSFSQGSELKWTQDAVPGQPAMKSATLTIMPG